MQSGRLKLDLGHAGHVQVQEDCVVDLLVIGEVSRWLAKGRALPQIDNTHFIEVHLLDAEILEVLKPETVFSPLICGSFDCLDVAVLLHQHGFRGRYRAMSENLPNPWLIRSEISESCPGLDFDIVSLSVAGQNLIN